MKNLTKITTVSLIAGLASVMLSANAYAVEPDSLRGIRQDIRASVAPTIAAIRREMNADLKQNQVLRKNIVDTVKDKIRALLSYRIHGKIAAIKGSTLTVTTDKNETVTVNVLANTILKRRFGGNSSLSEFHVGDEVAVIGVRHAASSSSSTAGAVDNSIDARYIRDLSIQKRNAVFVGTIMTMSAKSFTVQTQSRGLQTAHVIVGTTTFQERNKTISFSDLHVGDRVLVKGSIWDRALSDIDAAKVIKLPTVPASGSSTSPAAASASSAASSASSSSSAVSQASSSKAI